MPLEIEHKYLVKNDSYKDSCKDSHHIVQGYLSRDPERTVRIRIKDDKGFITVKGKNSGAVRVEFEYEIPIEDARNMIGMCLPTVLEKVRYIVVYEDKIWEVDEFLGIRSGLVTAEIELQCPDENYSIPPFVGENITGDKRYYNSNL